jgi:hypothetical protein
MSLFISLLFIWILLVFGLSVFVRFMIRKMKETEDVRSKNSLFTIFILITIPMLLVLFITPIVILGANSDIPANYKIFFGMTGIMVVVIAYNMLKRKV